MNTLVAIYKITCSVNQKIYIGSTSQFDKRWKIHISYLRKGNHPSEQMQHDWNSFGESAFSFEAIDSCAEYDRVVTESRWISETFATNPEVGYNKCSGGLGLSGFTHSEVTKEKIRSAHTGRQKTPEHRAKIAKANENRVVTDATRKKLSAAAKGKKWSDDAKAKLKGVRMGWTHSDSAKKKISEKAKGRIVSDETRKKIGQASTGRVWAEEQRKKASLINRREFDERARISMSAARGGRPFLVITPNGEIIQFSTLSEVKTIGLDSSNVHKCLKGVYEHTKGHKCRYADAPE